MKPLPGFCASGISFHCTEFTQQDEALSASPAIELGFEPVPKRRRERRPGALEAGELPGIGPVNSAQFLVDLGEINAGAATFVDDPPTVHFILGSGRDEIETDDPFPTALPALPPRFLRAA